MKTGQGEDRSRPRSMLPDYWWLGLLVIVDGILFWIGFTEDAVTVGTTLQKDFSSSVCCACC